MLCVYIATEKLTEIATSSACAPLNGRNVWWKGDEKLERKHGVVVVRRERGIRRRQVAWRTTGETFEERRWKFVEQARATRRG